jgi:hypothetical protein
LFKYFKLCEYMWKFLTLHIVLCKELCLCIVGQFDPVLRRHAKAR